MKVSLVFPRFKIKGGDPPLGLAYVAAYVRATTKADVSIFDATFKPSFKLLEKFLNEKKPDIVGIYSDTMMSKDAVRAADMAHRMGIFTVAGGPHASILPETFVQYFDCVVIGEGEITFAEIIRQYPVKELNTINGIAFKRHGKVIKTAPREPIADLDSLPFPAWDLLPMNNYISSWHYLDSHDISTKGTNIIGSRGCPFNCTYCQPTLRSIFGAKIRFHSADYIVREIEHLVESFGVNGIFFHDDTFTVNRQWLLDVSDKISERNIKIRWGINSRVDTIETDALKAMSRAGLTAVHLGAESGSQRILDSIFRKKITVEQTRDAVGKIREAGIHCFCFFMLGSPTETLAEIRQTIGFALSLHIDEASFSITTPLPMTHLYDMVNKNPDYKISSGFSNLNYYSRRSFKDPGLSNLMLQMYHILALAAFYGRPKRLAYILRHFKSLNGIIKLARKVLRNI
jgi:anaerobic magnesium-protoporphyrin IX monomethyl ester cyclase